MENQKKNIFKLCSFYVSDWHIVTMLLPYINSQINENKKIIPIFERSINNNVETLVNKLNLKNKEKILELNWKETNGIKYSNINNIIKKYNNEQILIVVSGSKDFIERTNINIEKSILKNKINSNLKIVNCYEVIEFNNNIQEILDSHDKILNTSGERKIEDIFDGYEKNKKINTKKA